ncbi:MAG: pyridoxal phosphate-dependent aminotransferase [Bacillota bacterium]
MLSRRARNISPSPTLSIDAKAQEMKRQGIDVITFGVGEPDFDTPEHIKEAGIAAIRAGFTKYTPSNGIVDLKEAIAEKLRIENGLDYKPGCILVSMGAKHSLYNAILTLVDDGDEVIVPAPYWVSYTEQVKLAGGIPVIVPTEEQHDFKLTRSQLEGAVTKRTKLLILNSPNNPTGAVYTKEELEAIAGVCEQHGIYVISDEIYEKLIYDGARHVSIASLGPEIKKLTVTINGVSKAFAMTGWRIGYAAAEKEIIEAMGALQSHATSSAASMCQKASVKALTGPDDAVVAMVREFAARRDYIVERLNSIQGVTARRPQGAFYVFPNITGLYGRVVGGRYISDDTTLAEALLEVAEVAVVPGVAFGWPGNLRFSYATSMEKIKSGLDRIEAVL